MLKATVFVLALALLCSYAAAEGDYVKKCKHIALCKAKASVHIQLRGPGSCKATAGAFCKAKSKSTGDCLDKQTLYVNLEKCRKVDITIDAKCWAKAAATAIAKAAIEAECVGGKPKYTIACAHAQADALAVACALAEAIVDLSVSVGFHDNAICEAKVAAAIDAIAVAAASATASGCAKDGVPVVDKEFALAEAIEKVIVDVFASCFVYCDGFGKKVAAAAIADGGAFADSKKSVKEIEKGGADAKAVAGHH